MRLWIALLLVGCASDGASDRICAACEPERGDTGDTGGSFTWCWGNRVPEDVDAARAKELGFDVDALEAAIARPIDVPLAWHPWTEPPMPSGGPATGYSKQTTSISARVQSLRTYRHFRVDPSKCDGTVCRGDGIVQAQESCARTLEVEVRAEVSTADGAARGSLTGKAMQVIGGTGSAAEGVGLAQWSAIIEASAPLSAIEGSLRVHPRPGALEYRTGLHLTVRHDSAISGDLSPRVFIVDSPSTGADYWPLTGSFPPFGDHAPPQVDAGAPR